MITALQTPASPVASFSSAHFTQFTVTASNRTRPKFSATQSHYCNRLSLSSNTNSSETQDETLLNLLRQRKTEQAWHFYTQFPDLPSPTCLSRLLSQLSYQNTPSSLSRARSILTRLRNQRQLHRLDCNSLGLLAVAAAKAGHTVYATSVVKSMLRSGYLPHVKAWSAVVSRLASSGDDGPVEALRLFSLVTRRVRELSSLGSEEESRPDTGAYNAVLNACANLGDSRRFLEFFDEMRESGATKPDVLSYNVMIKLCARVDRKDLVVFVLERIIEVGIPLCMTTLHSVVAAYVGFGDLEAAEKVVQAMRDGRRDICRILRELNERDERERERETVWESEDEDEEEEDEEGEGCVRNVSREDADVFEKLLPNSVSPGERDIPLLPKVYAPDSRIYTTLMKGYMKAGRVSDTIRMLEAMRQQSDDASRPDQVTYTTVVSALVRDGSVDKAKQVLAEMARVGVPANRVTYNVLIKGYCQKLQIDKARELLREMNNAGIVPDVVSYNILIDGCILIDDSSGALAFFNEMRARGIAPTKVSYTTLMKAFAVSGQPRLANKVFDEMLDDPRVKVDIIAWNMLVEGYCKVGLVEEAKKVVQKMKDNGFYPNSSTYGSLASGIALARKPGEALLLWNEIKERCGMNTEKEDSDSELFTPPPLTPDEGLLDTLADICVRAAFFRKALEIVACMEEYGISPNKTKYRKIYVEMHSRMFTSKHASRARQDRRRERRRAAEAFKFWVGLPNSYYDSEWHFDSKY